MSKRTATVEHTDILIIGGGCSGLSAALTAKECNAELNVLVVDKACASKGWAGKAARTAGLLSFVSQDKDPEEFAKYCLEEIGFGLNDQHLLREFAYNSRRIVEHLANWGVEIERNPDGTMAVGVWPFPWVTAGVDPDMCRCMAKTAKEYGVRFQDRIVITRLLTDQGRIRGACGFHINTGEFYVFYANAVILACGSQNFDITPSWCSTGVSQKLAYDAGCRLRNVEFCGMGDFGRIDPDGQCYYGQHSGAHTGHDWLFAGDENISQKWRPGFHSSMDPYAANAWYQETLAGNGPIEVHMENFTEESGELFRFHPRARKRMHRVEEIAGYPHDHEWYEVFPGFISEMSAIRVGHNMETDVLGLLAVGDAAGAGSARAGAVPAPPAKIHGTGLMNALFMGTKGGQAAALIAKYAGAAGEDLLSEDELLKMQEESFVYLNRTEGVSPYTVIHRIQDAMAPCDYTFIKSEARMKEALAIVEEAAEMLPKMMAADYHELSKCVDAEAMVLCARLFFLTSLERKESRGFHLREDYLEQSGEFVCWLTVHKGENGPCICKEDIPVTSYDYHISGM